MAVLPPLSVLIVEDHQDGADSLAEVLALCGHSVRVARSPSEALGMLSEGEVDVVLLDIGLPEMDGYELARRLRRHPATAGATLVAVTGYGQDQDRRNSAAAGFDHHLVKPVDLEMLQSVIDKVTAQAPNPAPA